MKKYKKMVLVAMLFMLNVQMIQAENGNETQIETDDFINVTETGEVEYVEVDAPKISVRNRSEVVYGVVNFNVDGVSRVVNYTEDGTGRAGYVNSVSGTDAAYLGKSSNGKQVKFLQAGVIGWVNASDVQILPYKDEMAVSSYMTDSQGRLHHYLTTDYKNWPGNLIVGYTPSYLESQEGYYSYDGHYFYTDFKPMIDDYKNNVRTHSVNANSPYYNYFEFISHRSKTNFTATQINSFINSNSNSNSVLRNQGSSYIQNQNTYGVNAISVLGVSINESGWGTSTIAKTKNNIFGHKAYDSDTSQAATYSSVNESIKEHAATYLSNGYLYAEDWRYNGPHLGDKCSGINVKYASDPYWGEKAAAQAYALENYYGNKQTDYGYYTIAIKSNSTSISIYKEPTTESSVLYTTGKIKEFPFIVLGAYEGATVNGSNKWYKVQSDSTLDDNRNAIVKASGKYDYSKDYGYVPASSLQIVHKGRYSEEPTAIRINNNPIIVPVGSTANTSISITPSSLKNTKVTYKTGNNKIATVDASGNVKGVSIGNTYLYATTGNGISTRAAIKVTASAIQKIYFEYSNVTTTVGRKIKNNLIILPETAITSTIKYSSSNSLIIKVNGDGTYSAVGAGTATVTAKGPKGETARTTFTVKPAVVTSVKFPVAIKVMNLGQIRSVPATTAPSYAKDKTLTYKTGNAKIARVDQKGNVSAVGVGNTYLYATSNNGATAKIPVKVEPVEPIKITFNTAVVRMDKGSSYNAKIILNPTYATREYITYRTGNNTIAVVDNNGKVTARNTGNTYLYATSKNGVTTRVAVSVK